MRDPAGSLALGGGNSHGDLVVAGALAHGHGGDGGSLGEDLVDLQALLDMLGLSGDARVAGDVEGEQFRGSLLLDDTTVFSVSTWQSQEAGRESVLPSNDFFIQLGEAMLDLAHIDIFPPRLLAFSRGLVGLIGGLAGPDGLGL